MACRISVAFMFGAAISFMLKIASGIICGSDVAEICPPTWHNWGESCFFITTEHLNWFDSADKCRQMGGKMAAPRSDEENAFIRSLRASDPVWIACSDLKREGTWVCDENRSYRPWGPGQPDDAGQKQDCGHISRDSPDWGDDNCPVWKVAAVCKRRVALDARLLRSWRLLSSCLQGHVQQEYPISNIYYCAWLCSREPGCRSFNVIHYGYREQVCQLNNATRYDVKFGEFQVMKGLCVYGEK